MSRSETDGTAVPRVLAEATWYARTGPGVHRTAIILTGEVSLVGIKALLAEHHLGDAAFADQVFVPYLALVHERDLPETGGASVVDPDTSAIRITSRTCAACPYTENTADGFADALGLITAHRGHQVCTTTAPHAPPGTPAAIFRAFTAGPWRGSIALQLAAPAPSKPSTRPQSPLERRVNAAHTIRRLSRAAALDAGHLLPEPLVDCGVGQSALDASASTAGCGSASICRNGPTRCPSWPWWRKGASEWTV